MLTIIVLFFSLDDTNSTLNSETKSSDITENDEQLESRPSSNISSETDSSTSSGVTRYLWWFKINYF